MNNVLAQIGLFKSSPMTLDVYKRVERSTWVNDDTVLL